jgi:hypothetical protein
MQMTETKKHAKWHFVFCNRVLGIRRSCRLQNCKTQKNIRNGQRSLDAPFGLETLKKLVAIAATLLVVSAGTDVPLEGSG